MRIRVEPRALRQQADAVSGTVTHYTAAAAKVSEKRLGDDDLGLFGKSFVPKFNAGLGVILGKLEQSAKVVQASATAFADVATIFEKMDDSYYRKFEEIGQR
ncbi:hypothetical protein ACIA8C_35460 [Nocardia sp. NPDC051321]|uniref:hypothetical protein n=1 Tax=Nocardia sp. NPDC051321 TaxID=3364323 RepID=UPI0037913B39